MAGIWILLLLNKEWEEKHTADLMYRQINNNLANSHYAMIFEHTSGSLLSCLPLTKLVSGAAMHTLWLDRSLTHREGHPIRLAYAVLLVSNYLWDDCQPYFPGPWEPTLHVLCSYCLNALRKRRCLCVITKMLCRLHWYLQFGICSYWSRRSTVQTRSTRWERECGGFSSIHQYPNVRALMQARAHTHAGTDCVLV